MTRRDEMTTRDFESIKYRNHEAMCHTASSASVKVSVVWSCKGKIREQQIPENARFSKENSNNIWNLGLYFKD